MKQQGNSFFNIKCHGLACLGGAAFFEVGNQVGGHTGNTWPSPDHLLQCRPAAFQAGLGVLLFVFREFMRHRIASYNEESARYRELNPVFYVPAPDRNLIQVGKPGAYDFVPGTAEQAALTREATIHAVTVAYQEYERMLEAGIAREVARGVLPVATYSSMYVTMNARSLMNFLSLRTKREGTHFPSFPQREIEMVAEKMEDEWAKLMPLTYAAFNEHGRVSP